MLVGGDAPDRIGLSNMRSPVNVYSNAARWLVASVLICISFHQTSAEPLAAEDRTRISIFGYDPNRPEDIRNQVLIELMRAEPAIDVQEWGGIKLPGTSGRATLMMAIAGGTAPDMYLSWFHIIRNDIKQGFLYPLNEWIGNDVDGNGWIDGTEAKWDGWKQIPRLWQQVSCVDGKAYGVPLPNITFYGIIYRRDLVQEAGLDPEQPPGTWDEFLYWCQKLTIPGKTIDGARLRRGQRAIALYVPAWQWLPWMQAAGGSPVVQVRKSAVTGKEYVFRMEETEFIAQDTGEDLGGQPSTWRANFDAPEGLKAARFYHALRWTPWIRDPSTGEPINLSEEDTAAGFVRSGTRLVRFAEDDVIRGVGRPCVGLDANDQRLFARGEVAMIQYSIDDLERCVQMAGVPPDLIAMMPFPAADSSQTPVFSAYRHYWVMTRDVAARSKVERDRIWECLETLTSDSLRDREIVEKVMAGNAMWCRPDDLERLGLDDYLAEVPQNVKTYYDMIGSGRILLRTEPFAGFWEAAQTVLMNNVTGVLLSEPGLEFDYESALKQVTREANEGVMFDIPREAIDPYRPIGRILFGVGLVVLLVCVCLVVREQRTSSISSSAGVKSRYGVWVMLAPAVLTIGVWSYYPLVRGVVMAFQDYRIVGESTWVGLDNFIAVALDPNFWLYLAKTFKFVGLTMLLGFFSPIFLAFLLSEVPRGKIFYRTLFFLPQMTSGIVIALLWKMMYDPTENGLLNRILASVGLPGQAWLQDPFWAMFCCILPGVWAGAGIQSLIYIAALKSFPDDLYEAGAIDGAGPFGRIRHITLPQLMPLMVINFIGCFIAAFQNMGHIFLLTFGGPGKETTVLGLAIWKLAYNELRFSTATTMAWFLGVGLIGFTYFQIRFLRRLEFRRVEEN